MDSDAISCRSCDCVWRKWVTILRHNIELYLVLVFIFIALLLFIMGTILSMLSENADIMSTQMSMVKPIAPFNNMSRGNHSLESDSMTFLEATTFHYVGGTEAKRHLNAYLRCLSESGRWVYDPSPRSLPWNYVGDKYASNCDSRHPWLHPGGISGAAAEDIAIGMGRNSSESGQWSVREELKWRWQTNETCPWQEINREKFCRIIGSKGHVMVVGDSLNHEISWSLMNALVINGSHYGHLSSSDRSIEGPYEMCGDIFGIGNGFKVSFVRNDRLSLITDVKVDTWSNFYEFPWIELLKEYDITMVLLNRGAHYEADDIFVAALREVFSTLSSRYPQIRVIYRNTQPGHRDCMNFSQPLLEPEHDFPAQWHWSDFSRQNLLAGEIVEEFGYIYMDAYTLLSLRPEGHISDKDCLHYCIPGPLDVTIEHLYNILSLM